MATLVTEHAASGLSQVAFCQKKNISPGKFGYYRSLFLPTKKSKQPDKTIFTPIQVKKTESILSDIKIILPNGFQCCLPSQLDPLQVKQLLGVLLSC